jgi:multiple sugar transport system permease protein
LIGFAVFQLAPLVATLLLSFTRYDAFDPPQWTGLANYRALFGDSIFHQAVRNTAWWVLIAVPLQVAFALGVAALLARRRRAVAVHRTIALIPATIPIVAATLAFTLLLNPVNGPLNRGLRSLGLPDPLWLFDPTTSKPALLLLALWASGTTIVVLLAGIVHVPTRLYDAAAVDGAGGWGRFRHVTLPILSPVIAYTLVVGVLGAFQYFTQSYVTSGVTGSSLGSPRGSTLFYPSWLYRQGFQSGRLGLAAAMGWLLFLAALGFVLTLLWWSRRVGLGAARR